MRPLVLPARIMKTAGSARELHWRPCAAPDRMGKLSRVRPKAGLARMVINNRGVRGWRGRKGGLLQGLPLTEQELVDIVLSLDW